MGVEVFNTFFWGFFFFRFFWEFWGFFAKAAPMEIQRYVAIWNICTSFQLLPIIVKFICANVWMPVRLCDKIFLTLVSNAYLKLDHRKGTRRDRQWAINQFVPVADVIVEAFCQGGVKGLEYANYYKSNALPETFKKLEVAARSELTWNC